MRGVGLGVVVVIACLMVGCSSFQVNDAYTLAAGQSIELVVPSNSAAVVMSVEVDLTSIDWSKISDTVNAKHELPELPEDATGWLILGAEKK